MFAKHSLNLSIDFGSSRTKMVIIDPKARLIAEPLAFLCYNSGNNIDEVSDALDDFLQIHGFGFHLIGQIFATGIRASQLPASIHKIPVIKVDEIRAIGCGGLAISGLSKALVVNMGTGTTFVLADSQNKKYTHLGGTGLGGGTLSGIAHQLFGHIDVNSFLHLSRQGELSKVDLCVNDYNTEGFQTLPPDLTISNLGKITNKSFASQKDDIQNQDVAAGLINLILQVIGSMALFAGKSCGNPPIVLTGHLSTLPQVEDVFQIFESVYKMKSLVPENAVYATAIGAALTQ